MLSNQGFPQSSLIVGSTGSGKTVMLSKEIKALKARFPDLFIVGIDPIARQSEDGLWETGDHSFTQVFRHPVMGLSPDEIAEWHRLRFVNLPASP